MSSVVKKRRKTTEEVTPEVLLERLEEIKRRKETFFTYVSDEEQEENIPKLRKLFEELKPQMMNAMLKAESGAKTKAEALYSFGRFVTMYDFLMTAYKVAFNLSLVYREDLYNKIVEVTERAVKVFSKIKKGAPLDEVINELDFLSNDIEHNIKEFIKSLVRYIEHLRP